MMNDDVNLFPGSPDVQEGSHEQASSHQKPGRPDCGVHPLVQAGPGALPDQLAPGEVHRVCGLHHDRSPLRQEDRAPTRLLRDPRRQN